MHGARAFFTYVDCCYSSQYRSEWDSLKSGWEENAKSFPNLAVMVRQYLGCPVTSATVERLFSKVIGVCFSAKRRRGKADTCDTVINTIFAKENVGCGLGVMLGV